MESHVTQHNYSHEVPGVKVKDDNGGVGGLKESMRKPKGAKQVHFLKIGICPHIKRKAVEKVTNSILHARFL